MIETSKTESEATQGHNLLLQCKTQGQPVPAIIWTFGENVSQPLTSDDRYSILPGGNLFIQDASVNDTGKYFYPPSSAFHIFSLGTSTPYCA